LYNKFILIQECLDIYSRKQDKNTKRIVVCSAEKEEREARLNKQRKRRAEEDKRDRQRRVNSIQTN